MPTKEYHREWARKNRDKRKALNDAWRLKQRELYKELKATLKCNRCNENHIATLQFHHSNPLEKEVAVSSASNNWSHKRLLEEISKCEVLCANCHAKEHFKI